MSFFRGVNSIFKKKQVHSSVPFLFETRNIDIELVKTLMEMGTMKSILKFSGHGSLSVIFVDGYYGESEIPNQDIFKIMLGVGQNS